MISSSKETPSTRDILEDQHLTFNCYQLSRGVDAGRPISRRWVSAEQCLCTYDSAKICDPHYLYDFYFYETSDEEEANHQREVSEKYPDIPPDRIGVFRRDETSMISVPPSFLDRLWPAAISADRVLRSITLKLQPQGKERWAVFEVRLSERFEEPFDVQLDKHSHPKVSPPRVDPAVIELRAVRARLMWLKWGIVPSIAIIAAGVLVALWIAKLWH